MTESEAIEYLSNRYLVVGSPVNPPKEECEKHNAVMDMAISALSEVQRYRTIGSVYEFRELKEKATAKKAVLKKGVYHCPSCGMAYAVVLQGYCTFCGQHMN